MSQEEISPPTELSDQKKRNRQLRCSAELSYQALLGTTIDTLFDITVRRMADTLDGKLAAIYQLHNLDDELTLVAGAGWQHGVVGHARAKLGAGSDAGYVFESRHSMLVIDFEEENRFRVASLLTDHHVRSGVNVLIMSDGDTPYGILSAYSRQPDAFDGADVDYLKSIANILAIAIRRTQTETALLQSEELANRRLAELESIYRTAPVGLCVLDKDLRFVRLNQRIAEFNGLSIEEHLGRTVRDIVPKLADEIESVIQPVITRGEPIVGFELSGETPARPGQTRHWREHWFPIFDELGNVVGINLAVEEITEQKEMQAKLKQTEARFESAFEQTAVGMAYTDIDGRYTRVNNRLCEMLGYTREEMLEKTFVEVSHPDDIYQEVNQISSIVQGSYPHYRLEKRKRRKDGSYLWVHLTASIMTDEAGNPAHRFVVLQDISQQKAAQADLLEANVTLEQRVADRMVELERSNAELDQFAYIVSHDLRAPLRAIDHLAEWIVDDAADSLPPKSAEHLQKLQQRVKRMDMLLVDLLAFSRVGRRQGEIAPVNLGALIDDVISLIMPPAGFRITRDESLPILSTYRVPLKVVLGNLIENAVKHHHREQGTVHVAVAEEGDMVRFSVEDDGPGIAPQFHAKVFEIFQTLQPRDDVEGSGLGLSIVQKTVEKMGGSIWLQSEEGAGTTVYFTWPREARE